MTWPQLEIQSLLKFKTTKERSANMRAIKATSNSTTERRLRALLIRNCIRGWKLHQTSVLGAPDFFFKTEQVAVFVDGCFWHGCPKCGHVPKANLSNWLQKLARNKERDRQIRNILKRSGVRVVQLWECDLRSRPSACFNKILRVLGSTPKNH